VNTRLVGYKKKRGLTTNQRRAEKRQGKYCPLRSKQPTQGLRKSTTPRQQKRKKRKNRRVTPKKIGVQKRPGRSYARQQGHPTRTFNREGGQNEDTKWQEGEKIGQRTIKKWALKIKGKHDPQKFR